MDKAELITLEQHFDDAGKALRSAWRKMKHNGMEDTAKEIADTVLDIEEAHTSIIFRINELYPTKEK